jgi:hypothetical protein
VFTSSCKSINAARALVSMSNSFTVPSDKDDVQLKLPGSQLATAG